MIVSVAVLSLTGDSLPDWNMLILKLLAEFQIISAQTSELLWAEDDTEKKALLSEFILDVVATDTRTSDCIELRALCLSDECRSGK